MLATATIAGDLLEIIGDDAQTAQATLTPPSSVILDTPNVRLGSITFNYPEQLDLPNPPVPLGDYVLTITSTAAADLRFPTIEGVVSVQADTSWESLLAGIVAAGTLTVGAEAALASRLDKLEAGHGGGLTAAVYDDEPIPDVPLVSIFSRATGALLDVRIR